MPHTTEHQASGPATYATMPLRQQLTTVYCSTWCRLNQPPLSWSLHALGHQVLPPVLPWQLLESVGHPRRSKSTSTCSTRQR